jgi:four helix bundle protein
VNVSYGSAAEARYLLSIALRLEMITSGVHRELDLLYEPLLKGLQRLIATLETME